MVFVLMIIASFAELVSIAAIFPFLGALTSPEKLFLNEFAQRIFRLIGISHPEDIILPITLLFVAAVIFAGAVRVALIWLQTTVAQGIGSDMSVKLYRKTLYQPYIFHLSKNSSEILAGVRKARDLVSWFIQPVLTIVSSGLIIVSVLTALFFLTSWIVVIMIAGFGVIYYVIAWFTKGKTLKYASLISTSEVKVTKAIQEGLGGIRDVIIDSSQEVHVKIFRDSLLPLQSAIGSVQVLGAVPRFGVEAAGLVSIAILAFLLSTIGVSGGAGVETALPILGVIALGLQRILPVLQQLYHAYITLTGYQSSTQDALELLDNVDSAIADYQVDKPLDFDKCIEVKGLGFRYSQDTRWILKHLSVLIPKGARVGIVGITGCGKSTLVDILMGLLTPSEGSIKIDGLELNQCNIKAWQSNVSHVPQTIFLADTTIAENIAFGVPFDKIDFNRVREAAKQAQLSSLIESWPTGFNTRVGERGVRISGGQRQRIGIARALYKYSSVIVFDEATSALDSATESAVMSSVAALNPNFTIVIIAHRVSTLKICDFIIDLSEITPLVGSRAARVIPSTEVGE